LKRIGSQLLRPRPILQTLIALFIIDGVDNAVGLVIGLLILAWVLTNAVDRARRLSRDAFYETYADARELQQLEGQLPGVTPLLSAGDARYAEQVIGGELPGERAGELALYTYEIHRGEDKPPSLHRFTVVLHSLPGVGKRVSELYCEPRAGAALTDSVRSRLRALERLELESVAFDRRFEIHYDGDAVWLKRVFAPSFIVWLAGHAPRNFAFELSGDHLCAYVTGHLKSEPQLDVLSATTAAVADRLATEAV